MIRTTRAAAWLGGLLILPMVTPAAAALTLCNRTSYLMDVAIGLERQPNVTTRGWFRIEPGQCRKLEDEANDADLVYVHARTPTIYGSAPLPQGGKVELCVREQDFVIADARNCPLSQQVRFAAARPSDSSDGPTVNLAEEADYDNAQARFAGMQRLLAIAGYDVSPIDGVDGAKTQAALAKFRKDRKLPANAATAAKFFDALLAAARNPQGHGFSWCNDTRYTVMASLGVVEMGSIVTRGWYRVPAGQCLRPELSGEPHRLYSYAEAVEGDGRTVMRGDKPLSWGGSVALCTREGKFELADHKDCAARGLNSAGFAVVDLTANPATTLHFKEP
jgi:uncharacterized membrane protein